ncbi:MAG: DNA polymerase III subunit delta [Acidobacteriota bacterium]
MHFEELQKQLKSGKVAELYLFTGPEKYLHREVLRALRAATLDEAAWMLNYGEYSVAAEGLATTLNAARQYPMFGSRRLVVARDFEKLSEEELDRLKEYLKNPHPTTSLVFQTENLDKRRNVSVALLKSCTVVELNALKEREATDWAVAYLRRRGYQIAANVAGLLIGLTGTNLFVISNELEKLMASLGQPGLISATDIETLVVRSREHSNFELADAIVAADRKKALRLLARQLADQQEPIMLLGMLARTFRQMLIAKQMMQLQAAADEIAREIAIPPFRIAEFLTHVRQWESTHLQRALKRVAETDSALKSSLGRPELQLQFLVCELLRGKG